MCQFLEEWTDKPPREELPEGVSEMIYWWHRWEQIEKKDGLWQFKWVFADGREGWKIIIPEAGRSSILEEHHSSRLAGHLGCRRTLARVKQSPFFWPGRERSVRLFCAKCETCRTTKPGTKRAVKPLLIRQSLKPMQRVGIDVMGPFPETKSGNKCILVVGDYATKWLEAYPLPNHKAETVASCLVDNFISRFGIPAEIHSDQGRDFESKLFQEMCQLLGIKKTRTSPWQPSSNGYIERFNATLQAMLRTEVNEKQDNWDVTIPVLTMAYRSSVHDTTGETPNMMMLGRELPMPSHLLVTPDASPATTSVEYVDELQKKMYEAHERARVNGLKEMRRYKEVHDRKCFSYPIAEEQRVWVYHPMRTPGRSPKLQSAWEKDPFVVVKKMGDVNWLVKNERTRKCRVLHENKLLPIVGEIPVIETPEPKTLSKPKQCVQTPLERMGLTALADSGRFPKKTPKLGGEGTQELRRSTRIAEMQGR